MKDQSDDKATTIKSTPIEQRKPSKDELSDQDLDKATGGAVDNFIWFAPTKLRIPEQAAHDSGMMPPTHSEIIPPTVPR